MYATKNWIKKTKEFHALNAVITSISNALTSKIPQKFFHHYRSRLKCDTCLAKLPIPSTFINSSTLLDLSFNSSNLTPPKKIKPKESVKLKLMLSYSKGNPWHNFTHPSEGDTLFSIEDPDDLTTQTNNLVYYDIDTFQRRKPPWANNFFYKLTLDSLKIFGMVLPLNLMS